MLGYVVYGGMAFSLGLLLYKLWDRAESGKATVIIRIPTWLEPIATNETISTKFSTQDLYTFSKQYITTLRAVFADPSPAKLKRMSAILAAPQNLHEQLWSDMSLRLAEAYASYPLEYVALLETVAHCSENVTQQYAAYRLASCLPARSDKLVRLADSLARSQFVTSAMPLVMR